jgi:predicted Zn-dependent protease
MWCLRWPDSHPISFWFVQCLILLIFVFVLSIRSLGQQPTGPPDAQQTPPASSQAQPQESPTAQRGEPTPDATAPSVAHEPEVPKPAATETPDRLSPPRKAQTFEFTKVDLELLRQVDAFDKYMEEKGWVYNDPETNTYLEGLGLSLVPKETPENVKWRFRAVRDLEVNAFAMPNGSIYVNSGLIARMENEAQLAGVLAHEITHVTNRHSYLSYRSYRKKMVAIDIMVAAASAASYAGVNYGIVEGMGNLLPMIVIGTIFGYSRELEHEADVYAVNTMHRQGYDLREFSRGFELLRKGPEVDLSKEPVFWASHPKLAERVKYVAAEADLLQPASGTWRIERAAYRQNTRNVIRHDAGLAIMLGRPRTAVATAQRLIAEEPNNAENFVLLGDAYRTLGARTPVPDDDELTDNRKNEARKRMRKMTITEYDKALLADPHGTEHWEANVVLSEEAFHKALTMDPANATAHRGLGFLFERKERRTEAIEQFRKYLELAPAAKDARQIRMHIELLEKSVVAEKPSDKPAPPQ